MVRGHNPAQAREAYERGIQALGRNAVIESLRAHTRAVLLAPEDPTYYEGLGEALLAKRKSVEAAAAFRSALDRSPESIRARFGLANALSRMGERDGAITEYQELVARDRNHGKAHSRLAISLYFAGRDSEAWEHVHQAEALGADVPPQFRQLLARRTAEP
jgi:Flp pilus assembly protein TadD